MTGTLAYAFVGVAILCVVAGVAAVSRTRRRGLEAGEGRGEDDGGATYAEEAAAVAAAEAAAAAAQAQDEGVDRVGEIDRVDGVEEVPPA
jgi:hypothetical protein